MVKQYHILTDWGEALGFLLFLGLFIAAMFVGAVVIRLVEDFLDWWWQQSNRRRKP
jgi:hypothetical protein